MSSAPTSSSLHSPENASHTHRKPSRRKRIFQILIIGVLIVVIVAAWQFLNAYNNSTDPTVTGRPLSNPHTHLHNIAVGTKRGDLISLVLDPQNSFTLYAGFFLPPEVIYSKDGGQSWQTLTD